MGFWGIPIHKEVTPTNPLDTDVSTIDTIHEMIALARLSSSQPAICNVVDNLLTTLPKRPSKRELTRAIYQYVKETLPFVR